MKTSFLFILLAIPFIFQACETNEEFIPQTKTETPTLQKKAQNDVSFYVSVTGKGEVYVEVNEKRTVVLPGEATTFEVEENTPIILTINENDGDSFWGWYVGGEKVTSGWTHEIKATRDLDINAVFGKILTINISGPGSIEMSDVLTGRDITIDKSMCPFRLFVSQDETSVSIKDIPSEDWYIYSITDNKGHSYTDYVDMPESKTIDIVFCEFTRYLVITESPGNVKYGDYDFTISGYEYVDANFLTTEYFEFQSTGGYITHQVEDYVQSKGLALTFSNNTRYPLKVTITFDGESKEYSINTIEYIELKSYNYQEYRLLQLDIKISK